MFKYITAVNPEQNTVHDSSFIFRDKLIICTTVVPIVATPPHLPILRVKTKYHYTNSEFNVSCTTPVCTICCGAKMVFYDGTPCIQLPIWAKVGRKIHISGKIQLV